MASSVHTRSPCSCRVHYAWVAAGVTFVTLMCAGAVRASSSVCITAFEAEFAWTRADISGFIAVSILLYGVTGPFAAALIDAIGMRNMVLGALLLCIAALTLINLVMNSALGVAYLLWGVMIGLASGVLAPVLGKIVANRWFASHAGLVMGLFSASAQTGQVAFTPVLAALLQAYGWRAALWLMAGATAAVFVVNVVMLRERPSDVGVTPYGAVAEATQPAATTDAASDVVSTAAVTPTAALTSKASDVDAAITMVVDMPAGSRTPAADATVVNAVQSEPFVQTDTAPSGALHIERGDEDALGVAENPVAAPETPLVTPAAAESFPSVAVTQTLPSSAVSTNPFLVPLLHLRDVCCTRDFLLLSGSFFVCGASTNGLIATHLIPACVDAGMPEVVAAGFLAAIGGFDIIGTVASGWLSDRIDSRVLLCLYYGFRGVALIFLPWAFTFKLAGLWPFAVLYGLDWIATVPPTAALCTSSFGKQRSAIVFAWCLTAHQIGAAGIASVAGVLRTVFGTYEHAFWGSGVLCVVTAVAVLWIQVDKPLAWSNRSTV